MIYIFKIKGFCMETLPVGVLFRGHSFFS